MIILSFLFFIAVLLGAVVYYIAPKKIQWCLLLIYSLVFYWLSGKPLYTLLFPLFSAFSVWVSALMIGKMNEEKRGTKKLLLYSTLILNITVWFIVRDSRLWVNPVRIPKIGKMLQITSALGMGYYTLQILGYLIDCYWGNIQPQKNFFKVLLFTIYFPQMTTGPISRWDGFSFVFEEHHFHLANLCMGVQRVLWGLMKKIVLAERLAPLISGLAAAPEKYRGFYCVIIVFLYPVQMYADFSGCMDIILGISQIFDVFLPENFNNPFFAQSSQKFWQRWHITLGAWAKDYVLYPLLKSDYFVKFGKFLRKKLGRKRGRFISTTIGMLALWLVMGVWHGGWRYILGVSFWYWIILMLEDLVNPVCEKLNKKYHLLDTQNFGWKFFRSCIVYVIYAVGATFFHMEIPQAFRTVVSAASVLLTKYASDWNPWVLFDGSINKLGFSNADLNIAIICVLLLIFAAVLREKYVYARIWLGKQFFLFRWAFWLALFLFVVIFGKYGPGYNPSDFIYVGF